ncbi:MAG: phosphoribosylformylglycinamidine cyclo-ligase [Actinomycetota bacterium]|nr:phosphoribosylformylglycinamidine cyclo-ligase [Actinomycetota bacterium]
MSGVPPPAGAYRAAGVDIDAGAKAVSLIADLAAGARRPEMAEHLGGFAGLFEISEGRYLAAATDGVGTKLEIARMAGRLDTVGIDLVAMCADDVVCTGAEPLFFLDYLAVGRVVPEEVARMVSGVAEGCRRAGCALLGGETAEHPGVMAASQFDMAGFCVGVVEAPQLLGADRVREGDALIGLASSGLHSNGYSLVRSALLSKYDLADTPPGLDRPLVDELLEPCAIHTKDVLALARDGLLAAAAHITGGGFHENIPRMLPGGLGAEVRRGTWPEPPIFGLVQGAAGATDDDMFTTFNMGLGMVVAVHEGDVEEVMQRTAGHAFVVGRTAVGTGVRIS